MIAIHQELLDALSNLIGALGILSTGLAAIITAVFAKRAERKRGLEECDRRIAELHAAYLEGIRMADERPKPRARRRKTDVGD